MSDDQVNELMMRLVRKHPLVSKIWDASHRRFGTAKRPDLINLIPRSAVEVLVTMMYGQELIDEVLGDYKRPIPCKYIDEANDVLAILLSRHWGVPVQPNEIPGFFGREGHQSTTASDAFIKRNGDRPCPPPHAARAPLGSVGHPPEAGNALA